MSFRKPKQKLSRTKLIQLAVCAIALIVIGISYLNKPTAKKSPSKTYDATKLNCAGNLSCWGEQNVFAAIKACGPKIERFAEYNFKWTDGVLGDKFNRFAWLNEDNSTLIYYGNKIQFQNSLNVWQDYRYKCAFDPSNNAAYNVDVY
jgi:hypothetical protein